MRIRQKGANVDETGSLTALIGQKRSELVPIRMPDLSPGARARRRALANGKVRTVSSPA